MKALPVLALALLVGACQSTPNPSGELQAAQVASGAVVVHATIGGVT